MSKSNCLLSITNLIRFKDKINSANSDLNNKTPLTLRTAQTYPIMRSDKQCHRVQINE